MRQLKAEKEYASVGAIEHAGDIPPNMALSCNTNVGELLDTTGTANCGQKKCV